VIGVCQRGGEDVPPVRVSRPAVHEHHTSARAITPFAITLSQAVDADKMIRAEHIECVSSQNDFATVMRRHGHVAPGCGVDPTAPRAVFPAG